MFTVRVGLALSLHLSKASAILTIIFGVEGHLRNANWKANLAFTLALISATVMILYFLCQTRFVLQSKLPARYKIRIPGEQEASWEAWRRQLNKESEARYTCEAIHRHQQYHQCL